MPNLPTIEVTQSQYDTIMSKWNSEDDFKEWLLTTITDRVVSVSVSVLAADLEIQIQTLRDSIYEELHPEA